MRIKEFIKKYYLLLALIVITLLFGLMTGGKLFYLSNIKNLFLQNMYVFVLASGMFICILTGGNVDLSCGSSVCFIAAVTALFMNKGLPGIPAILFMLVLGAVIGAWNGFLIGKIGFPAMIATLIEMYIFRGLANRLLAGYALSITNPLFLTLFGASDGLPVAFWFVLACVLITVYITEIAPFGKHIYAIGGNPKASKASGISESKVIMFAYIFMGLMTAITAALSAGRLEFVSSNLGEGYEMDAIAACFIGGASVTGGKGRIGGVIIGALLTGIINQGMSIMGFSANWQNVIKGIILVGAVLLGIYINDSRRRAG